MTYKDYIESIDYIKEKYPNHNLYGLGISLGANYLMNLAAEDNCKLKACISIANPFDIEKCTNFIKNNFIINQIITGIFCF